MTKGGPNRSLEKLINGRLVHPIGIGTWLMSSGRYPDGSSFANYEDDERSIRAIRYSLQRGQNHIDTAMYYGWGHTEEMVGQAITGLPRESLCLTSKIWKSHIRRDSLPRCVEDMLRRVRTDYLDLVYLHRFFEEETLKEQIAALNKALDLGLTRAIGISNYNLDQLKEAVALSKNPIAAIQVHYSLLQQEVRTSGLLDYCIGNGISVVAYKPVERGLLADQCDNSLILKLAGKYKKTPAQIAINWLIMQKGVVAIPKASTIEHIDENLGAMNFALTSDDLLRLSSGSQI